MLLQLQFTTCSQWHEDKLYWDNKRNDWPDRSRQKQPTTTTQNNQPNKQHYTRELDSISLIIGLARFSSFEGGWERLEEHCTGLDSTSRDRDYMISICFFSL